MSGRWVFIRSSLEGRGVRESRGEMATELESDRRGAESRSGRCSSGDGRPVGPGTLLAAGSACLCRRHAVCPPSAMGAEWGSQQGDFPHIHHRLPLVRLAPLRKKHVAVVGAQGLYGLTLSA